MGKSKGEHRVNIEMRSTECKHTLRPTDKNKQNTPDKLELSKYCKKCQKKHTFKEKK